MPEAHDFKIKPPIVILEAIFDSGAGKPLGDGRRSSSQLASMVLLERLPIMILAPFL